MELKTKLKLLGTIIIVFFLISLTRSTYTESSSLYNTSVNYNANYEQKVQEQISTYDAKYLAFIEKSKVADINKETFITVTDIIMGARKDGQQLAWKWVHENQNIPYNEFTDFYRELSAFLSNQYETLAAIERQKQSIVAAHNVLIKTYPNNVYNWYLKIPPMVYKAGFISANTKQLFNVK